MSQCLYCNQVPLENSEVCEYHEFTLFQINNCLDEFINNDNPPEWLLEGLRELSWIFYGHPRTAAFLNTAMEIADNFVIERISEMGVDEIDEINYTRVPTLRILTLLEEALIIRREPDKIFPGPLTLRLRQVRDLGYPLNSPELRMRSLEYHGILALAILRSTLLSNEYVPRGALSVLTLLSIQALLSENIDQEIPEYGWDLAFLNLPNRQENKIKRIMAGLLDGVTKIFHDINENGRPLLKQSMIVYLQNMRERYRIRERDRVRT